MFSLTLLLAACSEPDPLIFHQGFHNPSDAIRFDGHWVISEVYENRLAVVKTWGQPPRYIESDGSGQTLHAPHYLAISPSGGLLVSNGWGRSIVEIDSLDDPHWTTFDGGDDPLNAPHGICVSDDGWIYVGDSLNSRLVRMHDIEGRDWQVFADHDHKIGYSRQIVCDDEGVLLANSYERREGINPGDGGNVLRIRDFASGDVEVVTSVSDSNLTALNPQPDGTLLYGLWGAYSRIAHFDPLSKTRQLLDLPNTLGVPYGLRDHPERAERVIVAYFGLTTERGKVNRGGIIDIDRSAF
ncbi:hypothetical protein OAS86_06350 [Gammaproteobacteria bacterium]|nr:hypothetical protein [Gammaproteobacteria bacterium]